ncbi:TIGR01459 family HAD-type hydrolase [Sphingomonas sabuli]|uniref:TIGR01459 family HAD-type hydrolase n=1 Tax=Sphingomonas sabuli TaxID=2764186 RepID=A0A7G9L357_9SPHN|nr:TIGR01459 family HAD-type hydrolase [Sphingomonas sabuli]QNM83056.1 TIGR01459 family HAD-type hydrolase [Sphingomonas sabuli]
MTLDDVEDRYPVILCDIWGVIHDGVKLYPGAAARLRKWRDAGKRTILITNAPRTADAVGEQLRTLGLDADLWAGIATSGEAGIARLTSPPRPVGFMGTERDAMILQDRGVLLAEGDDFDELACSGLDGLRMRVADYEPQLQQIKARDVLLHCLNPDRMVIRGGTPEPCAGAIADRYLELGGRVEWYGKPYPAIYAHAFQIAGNPPRADMLAVGDSLQTDILGAAKAGLDTVYLTGGIAQGQGIPDEFYTANGLGDWRPVAVVDSLH